MYFIWCNFFTTQIFSRCFPPCIQPLWTTSPTLEKNNPHTVHKYRMTAHSQNTGLFLHKDMHTRPRRAYGDTCTHLKKKSLMNIYGRRSGVWKQHLLYISNQSYPSHSIHTKEQYLPVFAWGKKRMYGECWNCHTVCVGLSMCCLDILLYITETKKCAHRQTPLHNWDQVLCLKLMKDSFL